jgi:two-component system, OmpR family, sensor histidine kinase CreC
MSLRLRYIFVFVVLVTAFALLAYRQIRGDLELRYREAVEENMVDQAQLLASLLSTRLDTTELRSGLSELSARRFEARIYDYLKTRCHTFVYITDSTGRVLFHSADPSQKGADYSQWRDVYLTLRGNYGARSTRIDYRDDNSSVLYVAAPLLQNGRITGVVTLAKPIHDFQQFLNSARARMLWWFAIASLLLILIGSLASLWVTRPLRRIENDLAARSYIETYVQTLTHELKSPISAILGATEILEDNPPDDTRRHFLANIRSETLRLRDLVQALLQIAALERKKHLEDAVPVPLTELISRLRDSLAVPLHAKNIQLEWPSSSAVIQGDPLLLVQALHNLLLNAIEYSPEGGTLEFALETLPPHAHAPHTLRGTIRDHGPGVPVYALPHLGEKFYSLPKPATGRKGTGLGLSFAREALRLHGGTMSIVNYPSDNSPAGAQAEFELPLCGGRFS